MSYGCIINMHLALQVQETFNKYIMLLQNLAKQPNRRQCTFIPVYYRVIILGYPFYSCYYKWKGKLPMGSFLPNQKAATEGRMKMGTLKYAEMCLGIFCHT